SPRASTSTLFPYTTLFRSPKVTWNDRNHRLPSSLQQNDVLIADDPVQRDIPGRDRKLVDLLAMVRQPQQTGAWPVCAGPAVGEQAVVVAAAHAQAIAPGIDADQWHEHQIQPPGTDLPAGVGSRFTDAVSVGGPALARAQALEVHLIGWPAAQYRQVAVLAQFAGALHEQMRIDLAVVGQVEGDMPAAAEQRMMYQLAQQLFTGGALFVGSQGASGLTQLATQQNTRVAH